MIIAYRNLFNTATIGGDTTDFEPGAPVTNLQDRRVAVQAIADADVIVPTVDWSWTEDQEIDFIAVIGHNARPGTQVHQWNFAGYDAGGIPIFEFVLFGDDMVAPPDDSQFPRNLYIILPERWTVRRIQFGCTLPTIDDEPWRAGVVYCGPLWRPTYKTKHEDFQLGTGDDTEVRRSVGQQVYADVRPRYRRLHCGIPALLEEEAIGNFAGTVPNLQDIAFEVGRGSPIIVLPTTSSDLVMHRLGIYGHFVDPPALDLIGANAQLGRLYGTVFDVDEER